MSHLDKIDKLRQEIARRGLKVERSGAGWRVFGPGVDTLVCDLRFLVLDDLKPYRTH